VQEYEFELSVGEVIRIGNHVVTVIDIEGADVSFRVEEISSDEFQQKEFAEYANRPR